MKKKIILITGGAKSGKSRIALDKASSFAHKVFIATAEAKDDEMMVKIQKHKEERGNDWLTIEEPLNLVEAIRSIREDSVILIDCITLWLTNLMMNFTSDEIEKKIDAFIELLKQSPNSFILVTNEVGMGVVPTSDMGRRFIELSGRTNQKLATVSPTVLMAVSGLPLVIKE
ncbi:MAG: bifunctional adenosylcobinamide kinase/adenosylcobinamide-phosphate guanylyltransferase [Nitrospinae bacterium]|nr:bifunctional adenosylcobinamide kinase/adenosylcobinamide-phosphate guanylyltransferase [Nitrospinota bacterium]